MTPTHVVLVPSTLALLPAYSGIEDPIADVRRPTTDAISWLVERHPDELSVLAAPARPDNVARGVPESPGLRIAAHLLVDGVFGGDVVEGAAGLLVVANGTAARSEKAPGHLDERAAAFDQVVEDALRAGDPSALRSLDPDLGRELWAHDVDALRQLGELSGSYEATVDYADDPFGVQYWVVRWTCGS